MEHRIPTVYKILGSIALIIIAGITAGTIALRIWFPPAKIRSLIVEQASQRLHREVRLKHVSLGVARGLVVEGLEVSEKPDFNAGVFASMQSLRLRILWLPLLRRKVVIDEIVVAGPRISLVQLKPGFFNFSDLMTASDKPAPAASSPGMSLPFDLQAGKILLDNGQIAYEDRAAGAKWRVTQVRALITQLSLMRPFALEAGLQVEQLTPGTLKAKADLAAQVDLSGMASGEFSVDIKKFAANLAGLAVKLSGPVRLDKDRLDVPELKGQLGNGTLALKASIVDFTRSPQARLDATLSSLDLAQLMAVQAALGPAPAPAKTQKSRGQTAQAAAAAVPMKASGQVSIGKIRYHGTAVENLTLSWDLKGLTPDLRGLSGRVQLASGPGVFVPEQKSGGVSGIFSSMLAPLARLRLVPSLDSLLFKTITGNILVAHGLATIKDFHIDGNALDLRTAGTVDLPAQKLHLHATLTIARAAPIGADISGTFDDPKVHLDVSQAVTKSLNQLAAPAAEILKGLFK